MPADPEPALQGRSIAEGRQLDNVEVLSHWRGDVEPATDRYFDGSQSVELRSTSGRAVAVADYSVDPLDLAGRHLSFAYYPDRPDAQPSLFVELLAPDADNRLRLRNTYHGDADIGWQRLDIGPIEAFGTPDLSRVTEIRFALNANRIRTWIDDLRSHPAPDAGKVMLRFDDTYEPHFTEYFPLLEAYGYPGIEAVVVDDVGDEGRLSVEQLRTMHEAGWEMVNHTTDHQDVTELPSPNLRLNLETANRWLADHDLDSSTISFAYPHNRYDGRTLAVVDDHVDLAFAGGGITNVALTNPLTIPSIDADESVDRALAAVDLAANHRQLLVLMFHSTDVASLRAVLERIRSHGDDLDVIGPSQLVDEIQRLRGG